MGQEEVYEVLNVLEFNRYEFLPERYSYWSF